MAFTITPHDTLVALLHASGIQAKEEDTGGGCFAVVAPLPEGGEAVMAWEGEEWGVSLCNAAGGCEWIGSVPTIPALVSWVWGLSGRVADTATSGVSAIADTAPRDAARPGSSERERPAQTA